MTDPPHDLTITVVSLDDEPGLRASWEVIEADAADRPYDDSTPWESFLADCRAPRTDVARTWLLASRSGRAVGAAQLRLHLLDNPRLATLGVVVRPDERRAGVGSALLRDLERRAATSGRTTWSSGFSTTVDQGGPGAAFALAHGYDVVSSDEIKLVDLEVAPSTWPRLDDKVASSIGDYRLETFVDRVPPGRDAGFCRLLELFVTQIPTGDRDLEASAWTTTRLREVEARVTAAGRCWIGVLAVSPDDTPVGFTEVEIVRSHPVHAWVGGTLVDPAHRGHRLGYAMKLASHRLLRELFPRCGAVLTGNADVNAPMNAVNAAMGYAVVERWVDVQKKV